MSRSDLNMRSAGGITVSQSALHGGNQGGATMVRDNLTALGGVAGTTGQGGNNMFMNSGVAVGESEMDIEFGYLSEEESIFQSFSQDVERVLPKIKKTFSLKEEIKGTKSSIKDVLKRVIY